MGQHQDRALFYQSADHRTVARTHMQSPNARPTRLAISTGRSAIILSRSAGHDAPDLGWRLRRPRRRLAEQVRSTSGRRWSIDRLVHKYRRWPEDYLQLVRDCQRPSLPNSPATTAQLAIGSHSRFRMHHTPGCEPVGHAGKVTSCPIGVTSQLLTDRGRITPDHRGDLSRLVPETDP